MRIRSEITIWRRNRGLSQLEERQIIAYKNCGKSGREIGKLIKRSCNVVNNFLRLGSAYGEKKSPGRPSKVTPRQRKQFIRELKSKNTGLSTLALQQKPPVSKYTVHRTVKKCRIFKYTKRKSSPNLTARLKVKHLTFA
jgi:transposase